MTKLSDGINTRDLMEIEDIFIVIQTWTFGQGESPGLNNTISRNNIILDRESFHAAQIGRYFLEHGITMSIYSYLIRCQLLSS